MKGTAWLSQKPKCPVCLWGVPDFHLADRLLQLLEIILAGADLGEVVHKAELDTLRERYANIQQRCLRSNDLKDFSCSLGNIDLWWLRYFDWDWEAANSSQ